MIIELDKFGFKERKKAKEILDLWVEDGLPKGFKDENVKIMFDTESKEVFLTNKKGQVVAIDKKLGRLKLIV